MPAEEDMLRHIFKIFLFSILVSIVFFGAYYYVISDASEFMKNFIANTEKIADVAKSSFYLFLI